MLVLKMNWRVNLTPQAFIRILWYAYMFFIMVAQSSLTQGKSSKKLTLNMKIFHKSTVTKKQNFCPKTYKGLLLIGFYIFVFLYIFAIFLLKCAKINIFCCFVIASIFLGTFYSQSNMTLQQKVNYFKGLWKTTTF